ncbi:MAG: GTP-binding protein [Clostridia bacterium]|nr:GTP-binding protein [Clostridia bacterium]
MTKVDLITGFLGAGKTTFIHLLLRHLRGQKVLVIENEFGSIGVDAKFLRDDGCPIEDLSGMCMCCRGRGKFIAMLADAAAQGYDRVIVEPSGIYDVDEFFGVMNEPAVKAGCAIGNVLAIVDADAPRDVSMETGYLMVTQLLAAGAVILSKAQLADPEAPGRTVAWLNDLIRAYGGACVLAGEVCAKDWSDLTEADFDRFMACGHRRDSHSHLAMDHGEIYDSCILAGICRDEADLREKLAALMNDSRFGEILRAKGHLRDGERRWYQVNCTRRELSVEPAPNVRRGVLVVIGQHLDSEALEGLFGV